MDALFLLAEMCTPHPMRPHWSLKAGAKDSDLPYAQLVEADERMEGAAARPVIMPSRWISVSRSIAFSTYRPSRLAQ